MARRRRSRLRPALVALGLAFALAPLAWPEGDGPVDALIEIVADAAEKDRAAGVQATAENVWQRAYALVTGSGDG